MGAHYDNVPVTRDGTPVTTATVTVNGATVDATRSLTVDWTSTSPLHAFEAMASRCPARRVAHRPL